MIGIQSHDRGKQYNFDHLASSAFDEVLR